MNAAMFDALSTIITAFIQKLIGVSVEEGIKVIKQKRSLALAFLNLFDSLLELENASKAAYKEFSGYAQETDVPTKLTTRNRLSELLGRTRNFAHALDAVAERLIIYDESLLAGLFSSVQTKISNLTTIDFFLEFCPSQAKDQDKQSSPFLIIYPTHYSQTDILLLHKELTDSQWNPESKGNFDKEINHLQKNIKAKINRKTVDISSRPEAKIALDKAQEDIQKIERVRKELAEFIKRTFPMDEILR